jgi:hypothetical protein
MPMKCLKIGIYLSFPPPFQPQIKLSNLAASLKLGFMSHSSTFKATSVALNGGKFPLAPMGVLAPGSVHVRPSDGPPINNSGNFFGAHVWGGCKIVWKFFWSTFLPNQIILSTFRLTKIKIVAIFVYAIRSDQCNLFSKQLFYLTSLFTGYFVHFVHSRLLILNFLRYSHNCDDCQTHFITTMQIYGINVLKTFWSIITAPEPPTLKLIHFFKVPRSCWFWKCT